MLGYTKSHEWARQTPTGIVVGISDYAQDSLGDIVFVELPELHRQVQRGENLGVIESVKAASDIYAPVDGTIVAVNERLRSEPQLINRDPNGEGWIARLEAGTSAAMDRLMSSDEYTSYIKGLEEQE